MTDPKRLSLEDEDALEAVLLRAGRAGAPSGARRRALVVVASGAGAASGLAATGAAAEGTAALLGKAGSITAIKWLGVLTVTGASALGGVVGLEKVAGRAARRSALAVVTPAPVRSHAPAAGPPRPYAIDDRDPSSDPPERIADSPPTTTASSAAPPSTVSTATAISPAEPIVQRRGSVRVTATPSTVPAELLLLDRARAAMNAGDTARALSILDRYAARYPRGDMTPEATVLRIEALVQAGDQERATLLASAFLARAPATPYGARIRSLLSRANR